jgi:predicted nucleotidyltransferase
MISAPHPMTNPAEDLARFLEQVAEWASDQKDILAVALVGSHARGEARWDSDIDLVLLAEDPQKYLGDAGWPEQFGPVLRRQTEYYALVTSVRVWYAGGREVEFGWTSRAWAAEPLEEGTRRVIQDGMRVIFERGTILSRRSNPPVSP